VVKREEMSVEWQHLQMSSQQEEKEKKMMSVV
jgi:hypothetical protein